MKNLGLDVAEVEWLGTRYRTTLAPEDSGGSISIVDSLSPVESGPSRHVHHKEDETFFVITGKCKLWIEGLETIAGPGESVFIPRGTEHTFKIIGDKPCRHLIILTPGGFDRECGEEVDCSDLRSQQNEHAAMGARWSTLADYLSELKAAPCRRLNGPRSGST